MNKTPFVSIIIPHYNDISRLRQCISALQVQTYPQEKFEIIVIDNGSSIDVSQLKYCKDINLYFEMKPSQSSARNRGVALSRGEILVFTDSDCIPTSSWIECGVRALLSNPECGIVGGAINFFFKDNKRVNLIELYDSLFFLQQERYIKDIKFAVTANLFTHKKIFDKVGLFNENLKSGGDGEWGKRVFSGGYDIAYASDAIVNHPARHNASDLFKKIRRVTGGKFVREKRANEAMMEYWKNNFVEFLFGVKRVLTLKEIGMCRKAQLAVLEVMVQYFRISELAKLKYGKTPERQ